MTTLQDVTVAKISHPTLRALALASSGDDELEETLDRHLLASVPGDHLGGELVAAYAVTVDGAAETGEAVVIEYPQAGHQLYWAWTGNAACIDLPDVRIGTGPDALAAIVAVAIDRHLVDPDSLGGALLADPVAW